MSTSIQRDFEELKEDLKIAISGLSRCDVVLKKYETATHFGEIEKSCVKTIALCAMRAPADRSRFLENGFGSAEKSDFQLLFFASDLVSAGVDNIAPKDEFEFGDYTGKVFEPSGSLTNAYPLGERELLKTIFIKEKIDKQGD